MINPRTDCYYKFARLEGTKSPTRYDCTHSTHDYLAFELLAQKGRSNPKRPAIHIHDIPQTYNAGVRQKTGTSITLSNGTHLTSVFFPNIMKNPNAGSGDTPAQPDALLLLFSHDWKSVEMFIIRGKAKHRAELCLRYINGELDRELNTLRLRATPTGV